MGACGSWGPPEMQPHSPHPGPDHQVMEQTTFVSVFGVSRSQVTALGQRGWVTEALGSPGGAVSWQNDLMEWNINTLIYYNTANSPHVHGKAGALCFWVLKYMTIVNYTAGRDILAMTPRLKYCGWGTTWKVTGTQSCRDGGTGSRAPHLSILLPESSPLGVLPGGKCHRCPPR